MSNYFDSLTPEERDEIRSQKSKTFYEIVLDEIKEHPINYHLCKISYTFCKKFWNDKSNFLIKSHAKEFLSQSKKRFQVGHLILFIPTKENPYDTFEKLFEIRIEFLKFCVENNYDL